MSKEYIIELDTTKRNEKRVILKKQNNVVDETVGDIDVVSSVDSILDRNGLSLDKDILEVIPNTGPGSFTGIKTGIIIAEVLNWYLGNEKKYIPDYGGEPNIQLPNL